MRSDEGAIRERVARGLRREQGVPLPPCASLPVSTRRRLSAPSPRAAPRRGHAWPVGLQPFLRSGFLPIPSISRGVRPRPHLRGNLFPTKSRTECECPRGSGAVPRSRGFSAHRPTGTTLALCEVVAARGDRGWAAGVGRRGRFWNGSAGAGGEFGGQQQRQRRGGGAVAVLEAPRGRCLEAEAAGAALNGARGRAGGPPSAPCSFRRLTDRSTHYTVPGERSIRRKSVSVKWRSSEAPWPSEFSQHPPSRARPS